MVDAAADVAAQIVEPPMLVANFAAELGRRLYDDCQGLDRRCRRGGEIGRQGEVGAAVQVHAKRIAADDMDGEVVLGPAEPARLDVQADMAAETDEVPADELTVADVKTRTD